MRWFEAAFLARRPRIWPGLAKSYTHALLRRPTLRSVELGVTYACPMRCPYCSADNLMTERGTPLSITDWERVIDQSIALGAAHFLLTGGDPLLAKPLEALIAAVHRRRRVISIVTTGFGLTGPRAQALRRAGLDAAEISLDGASPNAHDPIRKRPGAFAGALAANIHLKLAGVTVLFTHVATRRSIQSGEVFRVADLCERLQTPLNLGFPAMAGRIDDNWQELLGPKEWAQMDDLLQRKHIRCCAQSSWHGAACTAGSEKIYITRFGDVTPCPLLPAMRFGNVHREPLAPIWARIQEVPELATGQPRCLPAADTGFIAAHLRPNS